MVNVKINGEDVPTNNQTSCYRYYGIIYKNLLQECAVILKKLLIFVLVSHVAQIFNEIWDMFP